MAQLLLPNKENPDWGISSVGQGRESYLASAAETWRVLQMNKHKGCPIRLFICGSG